MIQQAFDDLEKSVWGLVHAMKEEDPFEYFIRFTPTPEGVVMHGLCPYTIQKPIATRSMAEWKARDIDNDREYGTWSVVEKLKK
ncbi:MAG: hypothetical protein ACRYGR_08305 [Janthinobacterium lividum]